MSPIVRMKSKISGTRDGSDWPAPGETLEVPEEEAAQLVAGGIAVIDAEPETADAPTGEVETATTGGKSLAAVRAKAQAEADAAAAAKAKQEEDDRLAAEAAEAARLEAESKGAKK